MGNETSHTLDVSEVFKEAMTPKSSSAYVIKITPSLYPDEVVWVKFSNPGMPPSVYLDYEIPQHEARPHMEWKPEKGPHSFDHLEKVTKHQGIAVLLSEPHQSYVKLWYNAQGGVSFNWTEFTDHSKQTEEKLIRDINLGYPVRLIKDQTQSISWYLPQDPDPNQQAFTRKTKKLFLTNFDDSEAENDMLIQLINEQIY